MIQTSFENGYYNLFIADEADNNYKIYWISSRCVDAGSGHAFLDAHLVGNGHVFAESLYHSGDSPNERIFALRPVITLKSNVQIDTEKSGDGTEVGKEYILK